MATLYIDQYQTTGNAGFNTVQAAQQPPVVATTALTVTGTTAATSLLNEKTTLVRLQADTNCFVIFGTSPTGIEYDAQVSKAGQTDQGVVHVGGKAGHGGRVCLEAWHGGIERGEQHRERLIPHDIARAPDRVAEPQGLLLAREARRNAGDFDYVMLLYHKWALCNARIEAEWRACEGAQRDRKSVV